MCRLIEEAFVNLRESKLYVMEVMNDVVRIQQETDAYTIETSHIDLTQNWGRNLFHRFSGNFCHLQR